MSLPFVVSAFKTHSMQIKSMRENFAPKVFKNNDLNRDAVPSITSSKAHLHNRKSSRLTRKKVKKRPNRLVKVSKVTESVTNNVSRNKNKENQAERSSYNRPRRYERYNIHTVENEILIMETQHNLNILRTTTKPIPSEIAGASNEILNITGKQNTILSTKSHSTTKNENKSNPNDLNSSPSVVICSVRQLMSSYSTKNISTLPHAMWKNQKISPRPKTSGGKTSKKQISEIKIKRQSCPPALLQPPEIPANKNVKLRKVYYSEAQSHLLAGIPSVPPSTPFDDNLVAVEIVPCLADIKSQQAIKTKLKCIVTKRQRADEKLREKIIQEEKRKEREQIECLKQQRRAEIYALNEVMTAHERKKFLLFMKENNNGTTTISLNV